MKILISLVIGAIFLIIVSFYQNFYSKPEIDMSILMDSDKSINFDKNKLYDSIDVKENSNDSLMKTTLPVEVDVSKTMPDTLSNREKIVVPVGEPPQGQEVIEKLKCKELPIIPDDSTVKKVDSVKK